MHRSSQILFIGIILITSLLIVSWINVQQSWVFFQKMDNIEQLEKVQNTLYQDNKRLFIQINKLESPTRIISLIAEHPEWILHYIAPSDIILIYPSPIETNNATF